MRFSIKSSLDLALSKTTLELQSFRSRPNVARFLALDRHQLGHAVHPACRFTKELEELPNTNPIFYHDPPQPIASDLYLSSSIYSFLRLTPNFPRFIPFPVTTGFVTIIASPVIATS
jgi:hypothetical protein